MVKRITKNNKDFIFKIILSALLSANVAVNGIMAYNTAKIAKNTQNPKQPIENSVFINNEIIYEAPITFESNIVNPNENVINANENVVNTNKDIVDINETIDIPYIVKSGDKLSEIIYNNYGRYDYKLLMAFAKYNNIQNVDKIYTGDFFFIPTETKLNEIIAENNGFIVKTQTKPAVVKKSNKVVSNENKVVLNETKKDITSSQSDKKETKEVIVVNNTKIDTLEKDVNETKNNISALNKKVAENTEGISSLDAKVAKNTESIEDIKQELKLHNELFDFLEGEIRPNANEINSIKSEINKNSDSITSIEQTIERQENNIDVLDKKLDTYINIEATEINIIEERLDSLEKSWTDGSLSIDEVLQRMSNIEKAIQNLSNNTISKEEAMSIIDNSGVKSELIPQDEAIFQEEDEILPKQEKIKDFDLPFVEENDMNISSSVKSEFIPQEEAILPVDENQEPKAERIPEDEIILSSDEIQSPKTELIPEEELKLPADNIISPTEEKITDVELPYVENESEKKEVNQPQDNEEKMIFDNQEPKEEFIPEERTIISPMEQRFVKNISENIIAYAKTR